MHYVLLSQRTEFMLRAVVIESARQRGYTKLKEKQVEAVEAFIKGHDTFISLPTGYGKSVIYAVLPILFNSLRGSRVR